MTDSTLPGGRVRAFVFDLDGTLADTELQKCRAYADVIRNLLGRPVSDPEVQSVYARYVGLTDEDLARALVARFRLAGELVPHASGLGLREPWEALHRLRVERYLNGYGTPRELARHAFAHNVQLARRQRAAGRRVVVATSSRTEEAKRVVAALGLSDTVEFVVGLDRVQNPKPHPEIYLLTAEMLSIPPSAAIAIEDSPIGVRAAIAAGMLCVAVANSFTEQSLRTQSDLEQQWTVYDPQKLPDVVDRRIRLAG